MVISYWGEEKEEAAFLIRFLETQNLNLETLSFPKVSAETAGKREENKRKMMIYGLGYAGISMMDYFFRRAYMSPKRIDSLSNSSTKSNMD